MTKQFDKLFDGTDAHLLNICTECGMPVETGEYHPYAACLMFKECHNSEIVTANLDSVVNHGYQMCLETVVETGSAIERNKELEAQNRALAADKDCLLQNTKTLNAGYVELDTKHRLANDRIAELESQLPEGMENCTFTFHKCKSGHGWLTATNWADHGCPTCARLLLENDIAERREEYAILKAQFDKLNKITSEPYGYVSGARPFMHFSRYETQNCVAVYLHPAQKIDLKDFRDDDLINEIKSRGFSVRYGINIHDA